MNSDVIKLLPDSVANQIAAGEVIQRPASVVKELVENAVDAGASSISIVVKDAGRTLVQVIDNGCGMSPTDARMAFERHATSKIASATDLYSLHTMGFRGEALPSIVAVSQVELRTKRDSDETGTALCMAESKFISQEPVVMTRGSNLMVRNLFFNLPARRKFLKKDSVELSHIMREFERLALVNPGIDFTFISDGTILHQLRHAEPKQRIIDLFGKHFDRNLIPIETSTEFVRISGHIGLPSAAKKRGFQQFFSVNGRNMRHPFFHRAVMDCYSSLIGPDVQPSYFISFDVDPERIDVNVHPQKHEIKFEDEFTIRGVLEAAIRESLGRFNVSGAMDFDVDDAPDIPAFDPRVAPEMPQVAVDEAYNPFATSAPSRKTAPASARNWRQLYESFSGERAAGLEEVRGSALNDSIPDELDDIIASSALSLPGMDASAESEHSSRCMQLMGRYIVTPSTRGLMLIDQHRAHVNVLYARFMASQGAPSMQRMAFPDSVDLSPVQSAAIASMTDMVADMGFDLSPMGGGRWAINAMPADLGSASPADVVAALADEMSQTGTSDSGAMRSAAALALARASAIRSGRVLSADEMDALVADLLRLPAPAYTPDGLRAISVIDTDSITGMFQ